MSSEIELKPCPHCGEEPIVLWTDGNMVCRVECTWCEVRGPAATVESKAVDGWNALPRALVWSSEPPSVPGWYFTRRKLPGKPLRLMYVKREKRFDYQGKNPRHFMTMASKKSEEGYIIENLNQPDRIWAGPIPEPKEAK